MDTILQKRIIDKANAIINFNLVDLNDLVDRHDLFKMLIEIAAFTLKNQWISVEEALPKEEGDYNVMIEHDIYDSDGIFLRHEVSYDTYLYQPQYGGWESAINNVTHWMPIPSLKGSDK